MKEKFYPFRASEDYLFYYFESRSEERTIPKAIEFVKVNANTYNLAFGDLDVDGEINDLCVSNNRDMKMVLSTVVRAVLTFFEVYSDQRVYFTGSSEARTRLYTAILTKEIENWQGIFDVEGVNNGESIPFQKGIVFESFIVTMNLYEREN